MGYKLIRQEDFNTYTIKHFQCDALTDRATIVSDYSGVTGKNALHAGWTATVTANDSTVSFVLGNDLSSWTEVAFSKGGDPGSGYFPLIASTESVMTTNGSGDPATIPYSTEDDADTMMLRDAEGKAQVATPISTDDNKTIVNKEYADKIASDFEDGTRVASKAIHSTNADNLTPYSEESGTIQDAPFISQGTGTANNTASVDTSPIAKMLVKQGNTVVKNQLVQNIATQTQSGVTLTNNGDGSYTLTGTATDNVFISFTSTLTFNSHKVLYGFSNLASGIGGLTFRNSLDYTTATGTRTVKSFSGSVIFEVRIGSGTVFGTTGVKIIPQVVDLTTHFNGNDNIPQDLLDNPDHWSWYENSDGAYDAGSLANANGRYLVCTGRNLFDKATAVTGYIDDTNGRLMSSATSKATDYIMAIPNRQFHIKTSQSSGSWGAWYDKDKNYISRIVQYITNPVVTAPANARYMRLTISYTGSGDVDTFGVSLYYSPEEGGEGYSEYYPYEEPKVYDTGTEQLLKAGSAVDDKGSDGMVTRRITRYTFTGNEQWVYRNTASGVDRYVLDNLFPASLASIADNTTNVICSVGESGNGYSGTVPNTIEPSGRNIYVCVATGVNPNTIWSPGVVLDYELAAPTTEQGTTFPDYIDINDYGMMYWLDTDGNLVSIPQGVRLFYPVDYKAFIDTLVGYTEGDATSLVRWSDMATQSEIDEILDLI